MPKNPWFQFYPADWLGDPLLRTCSAAARGVLINMVCVMEQAERRGYFLVNGRIPTPAETNQLCGDGTYHSHRMVLACVRQLVSKGVLSQDEGGRIFSRRITKKAQESEQNSENGKRGGNPALKPAVAAVGQALKLEAKAKAKKSVPARVPAKSVFVGTHGLTLFQWHWDEISMRLGPKAAAFDLPKFCEQIDAEIAAQGAADPWRFMLERLATVAGLPKPNLFGRSESAPKRYLDFTHAKPSTGAEKGTLIHPLAPRSEAA